MNIDEALNQAKMDANKENIPVVFHRKNRTKWKVTLDLDDFMKIYNEYYSSLVIHGEYVKGENV